MADQQQKVFLPSSLLQDPRKEPLRTILTPYRGVTHIPMEVGSETKPLWSSSSCSVAFRKQGLSPRVCWETSSGGSNSVGSIPEQWRRGLRNYGR